MKFQWCARRTHILRSVSAKKNLPSSVCFCLKSARQAHIPDGAVSDGTVSDGTVSDGTVSDGTLSDGKISDGTVSDGTVSDGAVSDGTGSDGTVSDGTDCLRFPTDFLPISSNSQ